ncbi:WLM-domain-containing protein [Rhizodiscina lignyota]|uniref:WLM-domain-containing protein n=1 Tax=Rhizodiscina lignyota TaxID=1504668 RepID=A0A9P4M6X3_9PEZI|nr:WLM-domain-containing protein [Rhizodiscina lignyota]
MAREHDSCFGTYIHMAHLPRAQEALLTLQKMASFVKPIMRKRGWRVGVLQEFLPDDPRLYGLNENHGERILVRLRHAADPRQFMPYEACMDTLLHELCHIKRGPHDEIFHALWNELRDEAERQLMRGFTGEGFMGKGQALGGRRMPYEEMQRQARAQAQRNHAERQRRQGPYGPGHKLGGYAQPRPPSREAVRDAAIRRAEVTKGCASGTEEGKKALEQAKRNGFETKAQEDEANELAIQQAMIELMEEDEERKLAGWKPAEEGLTWTKEGGLEFAQPSNPPAVPTNSKPPPSVLNGSTRPAQNGHTRHAPRPVDRHGRPVSRLVADADARKNKPLPSIPSDVPLDASSSRSAAVPPEPISPIWACEVCTLENPSNYLACEACGAERSFESLKHSSNQPLPTWLPDSNSKDDDPMGWNCRYCGSFMEKQWWTCSACGLMKAAS